MIKTLCTRIITKHDISTNWDQNVNFTPLEGEIIIYTDLKKIKIGDGKNFVKNLPFITINWEDIQNEKAEILKALSLDKVNNTPDVEKKVLYAESSNNSNSIGGVSLNELMNSINKKIDSPLSAGLSDQFLVSDGIGGTKWKTVYNAEEVKY